ncbi:MAG: hypothetical protein IT318_11315 [Anaerolineales bacterium]|nr:hypothetical protein [Anaerolineales bacterium]
MITRAEWRWVTAFAGVVMLLTSIPYLRGVTAQTEGWEFGGFLLAVEDANAYIAQMGQGARGEWLYVPAYSSEAYAGALVYALLHLLGRLAGTAHTTQVVVYHAARVLFSSIMLAVSYAFLARLLPTISLRRLGLLLVALGGGLGWLLALMRPGPWLGSLPVDFILPEAFSYLILFAYVHLALARALFLVALLAYLAGRGVWAGLALLAAGLVQPLVVIVAWSVIGLHVVLAWILRQNQAGRGWQQDWRAALWAAALPAPFVAYTVYLFRFDPLLSQWMAQNQLPSPHPVHYLLAYGALLAPAALGWRALWRQAPRLAVFVGGWLALAPILVYVPIPTQRRLAEGLQLPLVALAVLGLGQLAARWQRPATATVLLAALPTALLLWLGALSAAGSVAEPIFQPPDKLAAFAWLRQNSRSGQVALSAYLTGNVLPAYTPLRAYIGLGTETLHLAEKAPRVAAFYAAGTPDAARRQLLEDGRIAYVLFGPAERALGEFDASAADYLAWRFESGQYSIYAVTP